MSIDTEMWVAAGSSVGPSLLRIADGWVLTDDEWALDGDGWQILVVEPEEADPSEAEPTLASVLGSRSFRVGLGLEPSGAPPVAVELLTAVIRAIATELDGIGSDPRTGALIGR